MSEKITQIVPCIKRMPCGLCEIKKELCSYEYNGVARKYGEWLTDALDPDLLVCSICSHATPRKIHFNEGVYGGYDKELTYEFCPNCGVKMKRRK